MQRSSPPLFFPLQASAIEDTLQRIALLGGVEGYVIVDKVRRSCGLSVGCCLSAVQFSSLSPCPFRFSPPQAGTILRQSKSLSSTDAAIFATEMSKLTAKARHVIRDLNPKNDLEIFRVRCKEREILTAPGPDDSYLAIVIQRWTPTVPEAPLPPTALAPPA